jgi:hypothetical protein
VFAGVELLLKKAKCLDRILPNERLMLQFAAQMRNCFAYDVGKLYLYSN